MPVVVETSIPAALQWTAQDIELYSHLPVWMTQQSNKKLKHFSRWKGLYPKLKWKPNNGDIVVGVMAEPSPKASQVNRPRNITETATVTRVQHKERTNQARIKRQKFESFQFSWLQSFRDFRDKQIGYANSDIMDQIAYAYDAFTRDQSVQQAKRIGIAGAASPIDGDVPFGEATDVSAPKDANFWANKIAAIGNAGFLDFRNLCLFRDELETNLGVVPWEGLSEGAPADNETMKGRYLLIGGAEIYNALQYDTFVTSTKPLMMNLLNSRFKGIISENIVFQAERYPARFLADGTMPAPEIEADSAASSYGTTSCAETIINPDYANAPYGLAIFLGYNPMESIDVGPPPADFAGKSISKEKFHSLNWNGQTRVTDDILVKYADGSVDTNKYGEVLQILADVTLGILTNTPRHILPVLYRRDSTRALAAQRS